MSIYPINGAAKTANHPGRGSSLGREGWTTASHDGVDHTNGHSNGGNGSAGCRIWCPQELEALGAIVGCEATRSASDIIPTGKWCFDVDAERAQRFASAVSTAGCPVRSAPSVGVAVIDADNCVTCTRSKSPVLT